MFASHIKPWRDSNNRERLDPRNGVAACPVHDSAFDTGLLTINGKMKILRAGKLRASLVTDWRAEDYFGERAVGNRLIVPDGADEPKKRYLKFHRQHVFKNAV